MEFEKFEPVYGPMEYVDGQWQKIFIEKRIMDKRMKDFSLGMARDSMKEDLAKELLYYLCNGTEYLITVKENIKDIDYVQQEVTLAVKIVLKEIRK